ncbi:MAG: hypothetical protein OIF50_11680 [Flavobacteriaceae bacterium]|nr:hypothetical protein [Flavobacteriaceae bacterium]
MEISSITIRIFDNVELIEHIANKTGVFFEKSKFNILFYTLDFSKCKNLFVTIKDFLSDKEELFKSISSKKDIFVKVDDSSGNFEINLPLEFIKYLSELGFAVNFDIYAL